MKTLLQHNMKTDVYVRLNVQNVHSW